MLALAVCPHQSQAAVLAQETFDTYTAPTAIAGLNGGTGFSGPWNASNDGSPSSTVETLTLAAAGQDGSPNAAQFVSGSDGTIDSILNRPLNAISGGAPIYVSFLVEVDNFGTDDFTLFQFTDGAVGNDTQSLGVGIRNATDNPFFARAGSSSATGQTTNSSTPAVDGQSYFLVAKLSTGVSGHYEQVDLFIDPTGPNEPVLPDATAAAVAVNLTQFDLFTIRTANLESGDAIRFDQLKFSTTFAEAVNFSVPEPSSLVLCSVLGLVGLARRRRVRVAGS